ncbi:ribonucleoside-diphosphate reductase class II [Fervidobacterium changbaicum]|uniref:Vitamin B12-dependent ribonucleotide reductase n=1 Tax=Fervidobacterium changbaicum TaxID=310769 RepID=A0ABX5QQ49_9BACT|nr:adenosylcobalamin-dependent ribonucleoside-diphosphate reductase [Fervidobacterium changbaicum]QAV32601.1 adenosylcobalamin-dependent ribonucleoside-diphosphate reductase [Fervidobacterium changbaicum]SDH34243.1 ribonucleoside-diphosphate reductase class II [Fervidobacterium changbaicum]
MSVVYGALEKFIGYWKGVEPSKNAYKILSERYFLKTPAGEYLENKWSDICRRVARVIATAELVNNPAMQGKSEGEKLDEVKFWEETFYNFLLSRIFVPNSPTLFNAGMGVRHELLWKPIEEMTLEDYWEIYNTRNHLHMLSACFVVPVEDSIEGIFDAVKEYALITKAGGGIGSNFSRLRPKGSFVAGTHGQASGPVSFMHVFNSAVGVVEQGYRRRGALMGILNIDHPDIEEFITAKEGNDGEKVLKFFNISVGITMSREELLKLYMEDGEIELKHPKCSTTKKVKVRELVKKMAKNAWKTGDPGLAFLSEMNKYYAMYPEMVIESTNPCGEIGLAPYEACNLGSIDVAKFFMDGKFDWEAFGEATRLAVRFLDNVIDVNVFPLEKITKAVKDSRRIGLGIMGFADLLYLLDIPYDSPEGRQFAADMTAYMAVQGHRESNRLAQEKGSFPLFEKSRYYLEEGFAPFAMGMSKFDDELKKVFAESKYGKRNVAVLTIAPTGSISNIADTSSGLEPNFLLAYVRYMNKHDGGKEALFYINRVLEQKLDKEILEKIKERLVEKGSLKDIPEVPEHIKKVFVTAMDISPMDHLLMQDAFQRYVDNNISKTINMPNSATEEDVLNIFLEALKLNIRGLTVYRDGSLQTQVLTSAKNLKTKDAPKVQFFVLDEKHKLRPKPRKDTLRSVTRKFKTDTGTTYITVSFDDNGEAVEIFLSNGTELAEAIGRLSSIALRAGVSAEEILEQLRKVKGTYTPALAKEIKSAIDDFVELWGETPAESIDTFVIDGSAKTAEEIEKFVTANGLEWAEGYYVDADGNTYCPSCLSKNSIIKQEGCTSCRKCGWSKCS